eukprot:357022-Chlamydomonas_euryale.AAC.7
MPGRHACASAGYMQENANLSGLAGDGRVRRWAARPTRGHPQHAAVVADARASTARRSLLAPSFLPPPGPGALI